MKNTITIKTVVENSKNIDNLAIKPKYSSFNFILKFTNKVIASEEKNECVGLSYNFLSNYLIKKIKQSKSS